ncbi:MAG: NTP transferase domain-containing protein [Dethiobacter sp.]|jgi:mannose-1-phosphate guanylyltransferase/phosphomannomutase|nr:NTP transferase domain-containing protein [Dethiobacter sp.]MBS3902302.1 NTP transferase domain-containing protein [Dethiobacter sp.]MBS3990097.1 NTP transferase domain-containing protein [Dethiobacter sp.]
MKAIIMAGGEGSRLRPLTCDRPKPMVPLMNRPMMEHIIALLKRFELTNIGVTLQYLPEQIENYFGDGREFGVQMQYFTETSPLGTAGSVKNAGSFLDETFLVLSGDALTDFNLQSAIDFHRQKGGVATLVLTSVENPLEYGVVINDQSGRITQFMEKPSWGEVFSDTVNTGIYILEPEALQYMPEAARFDFSQDLFPLLMAKGYPLYGYVAAGYWCDIGNLQQYHQAHLDVLQGKVQLKPAEREIAPGVFVGEGAVIEQGAEISAPVLIGSGARISRGAKVGEYSVIGANTQVAPFASIKRGLVWRNCYLDKSVEIRGSILCNRVQVMRGSSLFEGAVIGDDTVIEENCTVKPNVKIWPHKRLESGSIVSESLIWGTKPAKSLFGFNGISGIVNLEVTPELVAKLSVAYGSLLGEGSQVVVSSDDWKASRMLKDAAMAGLLSAGIRVYDLGISVTPVTRQAVKQLGVKSGIHFQLAKETNIDTRIKFFDAEGLNLTKAWERKIEQAYYREDFKRIQGVSVGETVKLTNYTEFYLEALLRSLDLPVFGAKRRKVLLAYPTPWLYSLLVPLLQQLNCEVVSISLPAGEPLTLSVLQNNFAQVAAAVQQTGAAFGVVIDANAEELVLFDKKGRIIADELFLALSALIIFRSAKDGATAVPITAPAVIERLAKQHSGRVMRTKTAPRSLMEALSGQEMQSGKVDPFILSFDAIASLTKILEFLAEQDTELSELLDSIPPFFLNKREVACSWGVKGAVMRRLIEETRDSEVELLDGVKVRHSDGWALVLPDSERPVYRVYGEGYSAEAAAELTDLYVKKIIKIQEELDNTE